MAYTRALFFWNCLLSYTVPNVLFLLTVRQRLCTEAYYESEWEVHLLKSEQSFLKWSEILRDACPRHWLNRTPLYDRFTLWETPDDKQSFAVGTHRERVRTAASRSQMYGKWLWQSIERYELKIRILSDHIYTLICYIYIYVSDLYLGYNYICHKNTQLLARWVCVRQ